MDVRQNIGREGSGGERRNIVPKRKAESRVEEREKRRLSSGDFDARQMMSSRLGSKTTDLHTGGNSRPHIDQLIRFAYLKFFLLLLRRYPSFRFFFHPKQKQFSVLWKQLARKCSGIF